LAADPALMQQIGDLWFRNQDFPGADVIADRLAAINPMAQIDEKSPVPPQVQMQLANAQKQIQQLQQQIQAEEMDKKYRATVQQQVQEAETEREKMRLQVKREDTQMRTDTTAHDTIIKTETQKEIEQMKAQLALVLAHLNKTEFKAANAEVVERAI